MARKTVKIEIPINNEDEMLKLAKAVKKKHDNWQQAPAPAATESSPLEKYDMKDMGGKTERGEFLKVTMRELLKQAQAENEKAGLVIGTGKGQTVGTKGTLYNYLTRMRDTLMDYYEDDAEQLGQWGYKVVTGEAKSPVRKPKG